MARPIVLTEEIKHKAREDFEAMLNSVKMSDGKLKFNQSWEYKDCSAVVWLTPIAYRKIVALVMEFKDEVAWHGSVCRVQSSNHASNGEKALTPKTLNVSDFVSEFIIKDIFVYPQEVTGSTVNTDQAAYTEWLYSLDGETFNTIRMQGHSHVNMGVSPSGIDDKHRQQILDQLEPDMFYIFMIWNKSLSTHTLIYDMASNILYENKDVELRLIEDDGMGEFLEDARVKVQKRINPTKPTKSTNKTYLASEVYPINKKNKGGAKTPKKQNTGYLGQLGIDADFDDIEILHGLEDIYDLGGRAWRL